jgi:hypothetical protein
MRKLYERVFRRERPESESEPQKDHESNVSRSTTPLDRSGWRLKISNQSVGNNVFNRVGNGYEQGIWVKNKSKGKRVINDVGNQNPMTEEEIEAARRSTSKTGSTPHSESHNRSHSKGSAPPPYSELSLEKQTLETSVQPSGSSMSRKDPSNETREK